MPATTASTASGQWAELPADLLRDIACRLHTASDAVRFDAVCNPWRNALEDQEDLLPWLLAPSEAGDGSPEDQRCRCVFSRTSYRAPGVCVRDRRVACADGSAAWLLSARKELSLVGPLSAEPLPLPFPREHLDRKWLEHRHRIISDDGAVLLYNSRRTHRDMEVILIRTAETDFGHPSCLPAAANGGVYRQISAAVTAAARPHITWA